MNQILSPTSLHIKNILRSEKMRQSLTGNFGSFRESWEAISRVLSQGPKTLTSDEAMDMVKMALEDAQEDAERDFESLCRETDTPGPGMGLQDVSQGDYDACVAEDPCSWSKRK